MVTELEPHAKDSGHCHEQMKQQQECLSRRWPITLCSAAVAMLAGLSTHSLPLWELLSDRSSEKKMWYIYTLESYLDIKKNKIMPCAAMWMDLEIIIRSEVRQRKTNTI